MNELDRVEDEAIAWHARLTSGEISNEELAEFDSWRSQSPEHRAAYGAIAEMWSMLGQPLAQVRQKRESSAGRTYRIDEHGRPRPNKRQLGRISIKSRPKRGAWASAMAASLALAMLISLTPIPDYVGTLVADHRTQIGQRMSVQLADGSTAYLNTSTALNEIFTADDRRIVLLDGEAEFDVIHDVRRPFRVQSGDVVTEALGTRFVVRYERDRGSVTVLEGTVRANWTAGDKAGRGPTKIRSGEQFSFNTNGGAKTEVTDTGAVDAWRRGRLVMNFVPLNEVLSEINRFRRGSVYLLDPHLGRQEMNVAIDLERIDPWLDALPQSLPLALRRVGPFVFVYSRTP